MIHPVVIIQNCYLANDEVGWLDAGVFRITVPHTIGLDESVLLKDSSSSEYSSSEPFQTFDRLIDSEKQILFTNQWLVSGIHLVLFNVYKGFYNIRNNIYQCGPAFASHY